MVLRAVLITDQTRSGISRRARASQSLTDRGMTSTARGGECDRRRGGFEVNSFFPEADGVVDVDDVDPWVCGSPLLPSSLLIT